MLRFLLYVFIFFLSFKFFSAIIKFILNGNTTKHYKRFGTNFTTKKNQNDPSVKYQAKTSKYADKGEYIDFEEVE